MNGFLHLNMVKSSVLFFFNYQKAFDSVPHWLLLQKLESLDFNIHIQCWVTDYPTDCYQTVVVNGESSQPAPVISGVPQGSVLGLLHFLIYINDLTKISLADGSRLALYADDVLLFRLINSSEDFVALQDDIDKVGLWSCTNYLKLNQAKCKYMIVSCKRIPSVPSSSLLLEVHPLDQGIFTQNTSATHHVCHNLVLNRPFAKLTLTFIHLYPIVYIFGITWIPLLCVHPLFQLLRPSYVLPHCDFLTFVFAFCFSFSFINFNGPCIVLALCGMYMCHVSIDKVLLKKKLKHVFVN